MTAVSQQSALQNTVSTVFKIQKQPSEFSRLGSCISFAIYQTNLPKLTQLEHIIKHLPRLTRLGHSILFLK